MNLPIMSVAAMLLMLTGCVAVLLVAGYFCCKPRMLEDTW